MAGCFQKGAFSHIVVPPDDRVASPVAVTPVIVTRELPRLGRCRLVKRMCPARPWKAGWTTEAATETALWTESPAASTGLEGRFHAEAALGRRRGSILHGQLEETPLMPVGFGYRKGWRCFQMASVAGCQPQQNRIKQKNSCRPCCFSIIVKNIPENIYVLHEPSGFYCILLQP